MRMVVALRVITSTIINTAKVFTLGLMGKCMMAAGSKENNMAKECSQIQRVRAEMAIGKLVRG